MQQGVEISCTFIKSIQPRFGGLRPFPKPGADRALSATLMRKA